MPSKTARTLLVLGPPHSGKSVFSYLLFNMIREQGNDCALVDCDHFSPTLRAHNFVSDDEDKHTYKTSHFGKRKNIPIDVFANSIRDLITFYVTETGAIVLDGIGMHTEATERLLEFADSLFVVCRDDICADELRKCRFTRDHAELHPFAFYRNKKDKIINITSCVGCGDSNFNENTLVCTLFNLRRRALKKGRITGIPQSTRDAVSSIAAFLVQEWL